MSGSDGRVLFLIDADNVSVDVIERALEQKLLEHGAVHVKRAYCSAEFAVRNLDFLKRHAIRAMVNATTGKNCTDIALAVDAAHLCARERPHTVVIVTSDSDFAPLVLHLRELGCRVEGVGQEGKTAADSPNGYDDFVDLPAARRRAPAGRSAGDRDADDRPAAAPRRRAAGKRAVAAAAPVPARSAAAPAGRPSPAASPAPRAAVLAPRAPAARPPAVPDEVARWLDAVPGLASGSAVALRLAAEALRKAGLLGKTASSTKLFGKHPDRFVLTPAGQPNSVAYRV